MPIPWSGKTVDNPEATRIERISVRQGALQVDPPAMRVVQAPSRRVYDSRGTLYLLLSQAGTVALSPSLLKELLDVMGETYFQVSGSITRGLRGAFLAANELLYAQNLRADPERRVLAGGVGVVVRQEDMYVAQMGPAATMVSRGMDTHRYPALSAWITSADPVGVELDREPPMGLRKDPEPSLFHASHRPDDHVVLVSSGLLREASDGEVAAATLRSDRDDLTEALTDLASGQDYSVLILRSSRTRATVESPAPVITTPSVPAREMTREERPAPDLVEAAASGRASARDLPMGPADPSAEPAAPLRTHDTGRLAPARDDEAFAEEAYAQEAYAREAYADDSDDESAYADVDYDATLEDEAVAPRPHAREGVEVIRTRKPVIELAHVGEAVADRARRLREGTESVLLNVLPTDVPPRPVEPDVNPGISMGARALVMVAMVIPLIVLFTVVMTRVQYDRARAAQHTNAREQASYLYDQAVRQEDVTLKRDNLYRTMTIVEQGLALTPGDQDLADLKRRTQHQIDTLEGVIPIYAFAKLYYFEDSAASAPDASRIVINGKDVMVLNRDTDRVYRFFLNDVGDALQPVEANPVILRRGDVIDGVSVGDIVDLSYMASAGSQSLARFIALDRSGTLLSYDANRGMRAQPVGNADMWLSPQAIGSYYGNLYVLDPLLGRLFKYLPSNNEYVKTPLDYFDAALGVDLTGAVDMTIDTSVYILYADGTIKKYHNGQPAEFSMRGFYGTMRSPVAIYVSGGQDEGAAGYVYVADAGNSRILQFNKDGTFVRQFRAVESEPYMANLRGLYVDEAERRMFLISGQHLVLCALPSLPQ